jgi:D-arabinose 1-dehydrogenase-like Zn-dependent alcohol dehydrogenase
MRAWAGTFDVILDTIPTKRDVNGYLRLLGNQGTLVAFRVRDR